MFSLLSRRGKSARRPSSVRPQLESLEDRTVPTVVFNPAFGAETVIGTNDGMQNPNVHLIFSGSYWTTAQGQQTEATFTASAQNIIGGPYLSGLTQYGASGTATFADSWTDPNAIPNANSAAFHNVQDIGDLQQYLQNSITNHGAPPGSNDPEHAPIYVVVSDPTSSASFNGGFNVPGAYTQWVRTGGFGRFGGGYFRPVSENIHMVWVGTSAFSGPVDKDFYTRTLSHELVETISDPRGLNGTTGAQVDDPNKPGAFDQIGDFEPESGHPHYGYRLGGPLGDSVQPYWSRADNAFIVPDGNAQNFYLNPVWNGNQFTGTYDLFVKGDQLGANYGDNIRIDSIANGSTQATMNGETVTFDAGKIRNINIDTVGGNNVVQVASLPANVTLNIDSTGYQSNDVVVVGNDNDSLAGIQGTVNVSNTSGQTTLVVDGGGDSAGAVSVTDHSVEFDNPSVGSVNINYTGGTSSGTGVTDLQVIDGVGTNLVYVDSVPGYTGVNVFGDGQDLLYGPAADQVAFWGTHW